MGRGHDALVDVYSALQTLTKSQGLRTGDNQGSIYRAVYREYTQPTHGLITVYAVFSFSRDRSRCGIKSCNPKNQIWDKSRNQWYLSHSGCGIKSGIHTTFLARNCGSTVRLGSRRIHAERAAKHGLGTSLLDELVQRTLDGSVQRPSPEADRARPAATVPPWMGRPD